MTDPQQQALPPLPDPKWLECDTPGADFDVTLVETMGEAKDLLDVEVGDEHTWQQKIVARLFTEDQLRAYAAEAVACALAAPAPSREVPENRYPPYGPQDHGEPNPWSATEFPDLTDEERAAAAGGVPMLDDDGRAMIANSHHYTAENIQAVIDDLNAVALGEESVKWHDRDWRTQAAIYARIIQGLFHDVPIAPFPSVAADDPHRARAYDLWTKAHFGDGPDPILNATRFHDLLHGSTGAHLWPDEVFLSPGEETKP